MATATVDNCAGNARAFSVSAARVGENVLTATDGTMGGERSRCCNNPSGGRTCLIRPAVASCGTNRRYCQRYRLAYRRAQFNGDSCNGGGICFVCGYFVACVYAGASAGEYPPFANIYVGKQIAHCGGDGEIETVSNAGNAGYRRTLDHAGFVHYPKGDIAAIAREIGIEIQRAVVIDDQRGVIGQANPGYRFVRWADAYFAVKRGIRTAPCSGRIQRSATCGAFEQYGPIRRKSSAGEIRQLQFVDALNGNGCGMGSRYDGA